jgi:phage/plasmid-like protein (TIGR03299 family)
MNIQKLEKTMNLLEKTGLNWEVRKEQFTHASGMPTPHYGIFRYEQGADVPTSCLGSVKDRYRTFQNFEMADTLITATESLGIETERGGELDGGRKVYIQAKLEDEYVGKSGIKRYITCLNSHDGSSSIAFGSTNTVVVCQNTFFHAYKDSEKFRHTASAKDRIENAIQQFRQTMDLDKQLFDNFKRMAEIPTNDNVVKAVLNSMFKVDVNKAGIDDISTRKNNQMHQFAQAYDIERQLEGDTLWGLFNAVTRYTNHMVSPREEDKKTEYLMTGTGYDINNSSYDTIMSWILNNTESKLYSIA